MRLYPAAPRARAATVARDAAVVLVVLLFALLGLRVHDRVAELASVGRGLQDTGGAISATSRQATGAVRGAFDSAAGAIDGAPLVGGRIAGALRSAGAGATAPVQGAVDARTRAVIGTGRTVEARTLALARLLGWLTFAVPSLLVLALALPPRIAQVRRLAAGARLLPGAPAAELARRAAYGLPLHVLERHTADPLGDLAAGRHAALLAALADDAGLPSLGARRA
jgi:hypothetical protein